MAPGDLNLKKSWNPALMKNQQKVWEAEQSALDERKKIQERQLEIKKEKELNELRVLQGKDPTKRLDWMYEAPKNFEEKSDDKEDCLLGRKPIGQALQQRKKEERKQGFDKFANTTTIISQSESIKQLREDPMVKIREEQKRRAEERKLKSLQDANSNDKHSTQSRHSRHRHGASQRERERDRDDTRDGSSYRQNHRDRESYRDRDTERQGGDRDRRNDHRSRHSEEKERTRYDSTRHQGAYIRNRK